MAFLDLDGLSHLVQWFKGQLGGKVDKVEGKQLSTNDYTTAEKNKLAGLSNYSHPTTSGNKHIPAGGAAGEGISGEEEQRGLRRRTRCAGTCGCLLRRRPPQGDECD